MINQYFYRFLLPIAFLVSTMSVIQAMQNASIIRLENNTTMTITEIKNFKENFFSVELKNLAEESIGSLIFQFKQEMGCQCFISSLVIEKAHRRQGHATAMLESLFLRFKRLGKTTVSLFVDQNNKEAQALYAKLGFVAIANFDSLIVLKKDLTDIQEIRNNS